MGKTIESVISIGTNVLDEVQSLVMQGLKVRQEEVDMGNGTVRKMPLIYGIIGREVIDMCGYYKV